MQDELARIAAGLPVASLWPLTVPYLATSRLRAASATAVTALYILAPQIPSFPSLLLLLATTALLPFTRALEKTEATEKVQGLTYAGRYIGWFERAVLFAFVIGGEPEAAAVALAAKSFARFPSLSEHHRGFAEYFLIGSLASLTIAIGAAAATRAALGIGPF